MINSHTNSVVILANGPFPQHPIPLSILHSAKILICCNGAADTALAAGLNPTHIIGDLDSLETKRKDLNIVPIYNPDQNSTDLEKALIWCTQNNIFKTILIGIAGGREDQSFANLFIIQNFSKLIQISAVTDQYFIYCIHSRGMESSHLFSGKPKQKVSLIGVKKNNIITTKGLMFNLNNESLKRGGHGMSNYMLNDNFTITVLRGCIFVFISHS